MTAFGHPHLHLREIDSTNDRLRKLAEAGAPDGTVVTADAQSAGRGRRGRVWSAPPGRALLYSALLRPLELEHVLLPLSVPVAVCDAIESVAPIRCEVKWPNDVWIERRKVAGILIEARHPEWAVIGIGVNVSVVDDDFPDDLRWPAVSVGHGVEVAEVGDAVSAALGDWVDASDDAVLNAVRERDALRGERIAWEGTGTDDGAGVAVGIDERGNLVVDAEDGERRALGSGEVSLRLT